MSIRMLHPRDVMLIRRLKVNGWSDERIWKEYRIPFPVIQKAKNEIERQATEEFENKGQHAVELAMFKERMKFITDSMDSIAKDKNMSYADKIKFERIKLDALAMLQGAIEASISSSDPYSALEKIVERSSRRERDGQEQVQDKTKAE
jgi:ribosome-associated translation inhibitor RaiA